MFPAKHDLRVYRGDTKVIDLYLTRKYTDQSDQQVTEPVDLTGHTFSCQMRTDVDAVDIAATLQTEIIDAESGHVRLTLTPSESEKLVDQNLVWDVQSVYPDNTVQTWLKGTVAVTFDVTRLEE